MPQIAAHVVADHHVSEMSERARGSSAPALSLRTARDRGPVPCVVAWPGASPMVADAVRIFESLGVRVAEHASLTVAGAVDVFGLVGPPELADAGAGGRLEEAVQAIHRGAAEQDGFNRLVVEAELGWRESMLVRAACRYLRQGGLTFRQSHVEQMMVRHRAFVVDVVALFTSRFDPALDPDPALERAAGLHERLLERLEDVLNL
jgi:glutamate dehydrogenase